ncbi:MAG: glycoside hydrolase family 44 protein [Patescibacteria group bacterium]|nr:glycoside hydrolase family 44 protein [Patescibacteria group bacterium]
MNKFLKVLLIIVIAAVLGLSGYALYQKYFKKSSPVLTETSPTPTVKALVLQTILDNKFGFVVGGEPESISQVKDYGAAWVRPHPGPFLWDAMQKDGSADISYDNTDKLVKEAQKNQVGILATLWPFASFDQKTRANNDTCKVNINDEFLPQNDQKGQGNYLPEYRCNPQDWDKYQAWVKAVVERYDGDGISDMPGLKIPIKYYEVMNEPDLGDTPDNRLDFYKEDATAYSQLLIKTSTAIRQADPDAKILIAGAAGGSKNFLDFYREIFKNKETLAAFDLGNVHCISNDEGNDFNVSAYKKMLQEFGLTQDVWVTEAENMKGTTAQENADLAKKSTQGAITAGAKRIFYTRNNFQDFRTNMSEKNQPSEESLKESQRLYKEIFSSIK